MIGIYKNMMGQEYRDPHFAAYLVKLAHIYGMMKKFNDALSNLKEAE